MGDAPTVRHAYAPAAALCARADDGRPVTRLEASELIERLRIENGHPAARPAEAVPRRRRRPRQAARFSASAIPVARELVDEMH